MTKTDKRSKAEIDAACAAERASWDANSPCPRGGDCTIPFACSAKMACTKSRVQINRDELHVELDRFLDSVEADPLDVTDGEEHDFRVRGGVTATSDDDEALTQFTVTTSRTRLL